MGVAVAPTAAAVVEERDNLMDSHLASPYQARHEAWKPGYVASINLTFDRFFLNVQRLGFLLVKDRL